MVLFAAFVVSYFSVKLAEGYCQCAREQVDDSSCAAPGTFIYPERYYEITMDDLPGYHFTYSPVTNSAGFRYVVFRNTFGNKSFLPDGPLNTAIQWRLVETELPGWYHLENRDYPGEYVTWSLQEEDYLWGLNKRMVLEPKNAESRLSRMDTFIRPVYPFGGDGQHYQLIVKSRPQCVFTWSYGGSGSDPAKAVQMIMTKEEYLGNYSPRGKWYNSTFFVFHGPLDPVMSRASRAINEALASFMVAIFINDMII